MAASRFRRPSSIDRLDPQIKDMIGTLRIDHGWTIDEIREKLLELGKSVSRSALGRHLMSIEEIGENLRYSREMANALAARAESGSEAKLVSLANELLMGSILRLLTAVKDGLPFECTPKEAMLLSTALKQSAATEAAVAEIKRKAEEAERKRSAEKAKDAATKAGLSRETIDQIYQAVLGVEA